MLLPFSYAMAERRCMLIKYRNDTRYSLAGVVTHDKCESWENWEQGDPMKGDASKRSQKARTDARFRVLLLSFASLFFSSPPHLSCCAPSLHMVRVFPFWQSLSCLYLPSPLPCWLGSHLSLSSCSIFFLSLSLLLSLLCLSLSFSLSFFFSLLLS